MAISVVLGCHSADLPPLVLESEHFRVHAYDDDPVCGRFGERLEDHYAAVAGYLGVALESDEKIDVYKYRSAEELAAQSPCAEGAHGCGGEEQVHLYTFNTPFEHELVHAYAALGGKAPRIFEEGLATMLQEWDGLGPGRRPPDHSATMLENVIASEDWQNSPDPSYGAAGSFVRSLVDRHGIGVFQSFHNAVPRDAAVEEIDAAFVVAFGETLADALAAWRATAEPGNGWLPIAACASPPLAPQEDTMLEELACGRARRSLSTTEAEGLVIVIRHDHNVSAHVRLCSGVRDLWPAERSVWAFHATGEQRELWTSLAPGEYYLEASAFTPGVDTVHPFVSVTWSRPVADRCDAVVERVVPSDTRQVEVPVWFDALAGSAADPALADAFVRFAVESPRRLSVRIDPPDYLASDFFADGAEHVSAVSLCTGICETSCTTLGSTPADVAAGQPYTLILEATPGDRRTFGLAFEP